MLTIRRAADRGHADHGWLNSRHTFSFADYYDPRHMGFGTLRVINDDTVAPGQGFGTHPHRDMEIISYVLDGALAHRDSLGNGSVIRPGDVQRMSAGTGVTHSEYNASEDEPVHFLQIWIVPDAPRHEPGYEQKHFSREDRQGRLRLVAAASGRDGAVSLHQDADIHAGLLDAEDATSFEVRPDRDVWVHLARGALSVNGEPLGAGDGVAVRQPGTLSFEAANQAELLVFDLGRPV